MKLTKRTYDGTLCVLTVALYLTGSLPMVPVAPVSRINGVLALTPSYRADARRTSKELFCRHPSLPFTRSMPNQRSDNAKDRREKSSPDKQKHERQNQ